MAACHDWWHVFRLHLYRQFQRQLCRFLDCPSHGLFVGFHSIDERQEWTIFKCLRVRQALCCGFHMSLISIHRITIATLLSFLCAVFAGTHRFCYSAMASSSVVLILPVSWNPFHQMCFFSSRTHSQGFIVTVGALELTSRSIVSGAVRLCFAMVYSLFLGFGLAIGSEVYQKMTGKTIVGSQDYSCALSHNPNGPWWQKTPRLHWGERVCFYFP
jgi:hypothetical protein